mmetsp:Transcript_21626/g.58155  ORF Transcript_21626/g.58155 Transcript_21626/m.58155 type:complete len:368 (-) Transcript_21626:996-2099(-)
MGTRLSHEVERARCTATDAGDAAVDGIAHVARELAIVLALAVVVPRQLGPRRRVLGADDGGYHVEDDEAAGRDDGADDELHLAADVRLVAVRLKVEVVGQANVLEVVVEATAREGRHEGDLHHVGVALEAHALLPHADVVHFARHGPPRDLNHLGQVGARLHHVVDVVDDRGEGPQQRVDGAVRQEEREVVPVVEEAEPAAVGLVAELEQEPGAWALIDALLGIGLVRLRLENEGQDVLEKVGESLHDDERCERDGGDLIEVDVELILLVEEAHSRDLDLLELFERGVHGERDVVEAEDPEEAIAVDVDEEEHLEDPLVVELLVGAVVLHRAEPTSHLLEGGEQTHHDDDAVHRGVQTRAQQHAYRH